jgi:signal transduction histidine kinase
MAVDEGSLMASLRLRTQLLVATLLIICPLTGALLFIVRYAVRSEIAKQVQENTGTSLRAFESVQRDRQLQLSRTAAMLAELPTLKALMTTQHALTIQDASDPFWKLAGSDLFLLANTRGEVLGFHVAKAGWTTPVAEQNLNRSIEQGEDTAWWYAEGKLYSVVLRPITAGGEKDRRQLGILAVGYQVDSTVAQQLALFSASQIALVTDDKIIASTLLPVEQAELERWISGRDLLADNGTRELLLAPDPYQVASVLIHKGPATPVRCYVLMPLHQPNGFIQRLNRMILILGISAIMLAAMLLTFVSRTITHPLDNLVAGVRALAIGDYTYAIRPRGSSEVAELGEAFSKMRGELLTSQQRRLASERITALGRAASSISHDLRHYLSAVVANAEFLYEAERLKLNRDEIYEEIKAASNQMIDLVDSLRELAREDAAISPVRASLYHTIRQAVEAVLSSHELRNRGIAIGASGPMDGVFDPKKIERAFFNLLLNACEAMADRPGEIKVNIRSLADWFEIHVVDNGCGIPSSIRGTLFDPFVSYGKPNGTGLGLAIVNKIVNDHGGAVSVETTSEAGTAFLVKLPRSLPAAIMIGRSVVSSS